MFVTPPYSLNLSEEDASRIEAELHYAFEKVLAPYFNRGPNLLENPFMVDLLGLNPEKQKIIENNMGFWSSSFDYRKTKPFFEMNYEYTIDNRFIHYPIPDNYDNWGLDENGNGWSHSFCVMDDFGTAVPISPFIYQLEDCAVCLAPDYKNPPSVGEPYKYIIHYPTLH